MTGLKTVTLKAFMASVGHLAAEQQLDVSVPHGDGTNTVAKKGVMASGTLGLNTRRARKSSRSRQPWLCVVAPPVAPVNETDMVL